MCWKALAKLLRYYKIKRLEHRPWFYKSGGQTSVRKQLFSLLSEFRHLLFDLRNFFLQNNDLLFQVGHAFIVV
jgi:hypothetical protein